MKLHLKNKIILLALALSIASVDAYKYTFFNATDKKADFRAFELVAYKFFGRYTPILGYDEQGERAFVSAEPKYTANIRGEGWRRGLCLGAVEVRLAGETDWRIAPIKIVKTDQRDTIENELKKLGVAITKGGKAISLALILALPVAAPIVLSVTYVIGKILTYAPRLDTMNMCTSRDFVFMAHWNQAENRWDPFIYYFEN